MRETSRAVDKKLQVNNHLKDFKEWQDPIKDFVLPSFWQNMNRPLLYGVAMGAVTGYLVGGTKFGKMIGTVVGAGAIIGAKTYKAAYETTTGEKWIPDEKRKEREINDYMDKLKFIKNRRLFEAYSQKALEEDGVDVKEIIASNKAQGNKRKKEKKQIQEVKNEAIRSGKIKTKEFEKVGVEINKEDKLPAFIRGIVTGETTDRLVENTKKLYNLSKDGNGEFTKIMKEYKDILVDSKKKKKRSIMRSVNSDINSKMNNKVVFDLPDNALKAIEYYNESEKTMQGFDPGEQLSNIISALPKKDRQYFRHFMEAPEKEREKILSIAPKYMKRALQSAYGMKVDEKDDLASYFSEHYLPGEDWDGWQEGFNLDAMKVKIVQNSGLELGSFDIWEDDKIEADMYGPMAIPNIKYKTKNTEVVKRKMSKILGDAGYKDLNFSFKFGTAQSGINLDLYEDRKEKYENKLKERLGVF